MASDISESKQYVIDDDISNEMVEATEMDGALLWDLLQELEEEEEEESKNNNNPKEAAADHKFIEGNNYNIISDNYGHAFLKQEDDDHHEYSKGVDLLEISSSTSNNSSSLPLPSDHDVGGAWYTADDDMVGIMDYYFGCNNIIGDYSHYYYYYYHLYNNHGAATANSYTAADQITYSLWEGC